jgi:hypothetical protein
LGAISRDEQTITNQRLILNKGARAAERYGGQRRGRPTNVIMSSQLCDGLLLY